jgi:hypothetical protein
MHFEKGREFKPPGAIKRLEPHETGVDVRISIWRPSIN